MAKNSKPTWKPSRPIARGKRRYASKLVWRGEPLGDCRVLSEAEFAKFKQSDTAKQWLADLAYYKHQQETDRRLKEEWRKANSDKPDRELLIAR